MQTPLFLSSDKKFLIGSNFKIPTKYIKYWYQESSPLSLIQNNIVFVLKPKKELKDLIDCDGCFKTNGPLPAKLHQELVYLSYPDAPKIEHLPQIETLDSVNKNDSFHKTAIAWTLGITVTVFVMGIMCESRSRSYYY
jgi:hypothetical protein